MRTLTIKCEAEGSRSSSPHGSTLGEGGRTGLRPGWAAAAATAAAVGSHLMNTTVT